MAVRRRRPRGRGLLRRGRVRVGRDYDYDLDADIAAGLIINHLAMLTSPTWAAQRQDSAAAIRGISETLLGHATDEPSLGDACEWHIERHPDGARLQPRQAQPM